MKRSLGLFLSILILGFFSTPWAIGQPGGVFNDTKIHLPADYTTWSPPEAGVSFSDGVFGSSLTRLSHGMAQFKGAVYHESASVSAFNLDNTRILLATDQGYYVVHMQTYGG